jgi:hypothetical protein
MPSPISTTPMSKSSTDMTVALLEISQPFKEVSVRVAESPAAK